MNKNHDLRGSVSVALVLLACKKSNLMDICSVNRALARTPSVMAKGAVLSPDYIDYNCIPLCDWRCGFILYVKV